MPHSRRTPLRRRGALMAARGIAVAALLIALAFLMHPLVPGVFGTAVATALPWLGLLAPATMLAALATRRRRAWLVGAVPLAAWLVVMAPQLLPAPAAAAPHPGESTLTVASQNVQEGSGTAAESARLLAGRGADVIALEELDPAARAAAAEALGADYPHSYAVGTVGLWSRYPVTNRQALDLDLGWDRAIAAEVQTPSGPVAVYVVHAASLRPGIQQDRDGMLGELATTVARDESEQVVVLGDFNATTTDPALRALQATVSESGQAGFSLGFTWPAEMPVARIDHVFQRGLRTLESSVVVAGASDHRAVLTRFAVPAADAD